MGLLHPRVVLDQITPSPLVTMDALGRYVGFQIPGSSVLTGDEMSRVHFLPMLSLAARNTTDISPFIRIPLPDEQRELLV